MGRVVYTETPVIDTMQILARLYISICMRMGGKRGGKRFQIQMVALTFVTAVLRYEVWFFRSQSNKNSFYENNMEGFFLTATFLGFPKTSGLCFN